MVNRRSAVAAALDRDRPVLIAGATASGKSALALEIAERSGGVIVNADALQVYADWRVLTARPSPEDEARVPHALYGHVSGTSRYSVGDWLGDVEGLLRGARPIVVGGTGLYFAALTEGLAQIPQTPAEVRAEACARLADGGAVALAGDLDTPTRARIDLRNPVRIQRAWEVLRSTGRGLASWQDETPPPLLPPASAQALLVDAPREWLAERIRARAARMLAGGAVDEARANRPGWSPALPSAKAIGAAELVAHLDGRLSLVAAEARIATLTRQYAKRQRTWFRARMSDWNRIDAQDLDPEAH